MQILDPVARKAPSGQTRTRRLAALAGARVAILTNHWRSMDAMIAVFGPRLAERHGAAEVHVYGVPLNGPMSDDTRRRVLAECDAALVGLAN